MLINDQYSEQPNSNQSSFGPSNQNTTFSGATPTPTQGNSFAPTGNQQQQFEGQQNQQTLPWQQTAWTQQQQPQQSQQVGHGGTTAGGMNREQWRDAWMSSGTSNINDMQNWMQQHGGTVLSGNGTVLTPFGEILDMGTAYRTGQGTPGWTPVGSGSSLPAGSQNPFVNPQGGFNPNPFGGMLNPGGQMPAQGQFSQGQTGNINSMLAQMFGGQVPGGQVPQGQGQGMPQGLFGPYMDKFNQMNGGNQMDISSLLNPANQQFLGGSRTFNESGGPVGPMIPQAGSSWSSSPIQPGPFGPQAGNFQNVMQRNPASFIGGR